MNFIQACSIFWKAWKIHTSHMIIISCYCCWVTQSCPTHTQVAHILQHTRLPRLSLSPRVCSNSCSLNQWYYPTISCSISPFSSCPQSFPESGSFPMSQLFPSSGQSIGASALASVFPMNIQGWFPLGLTGLISLLPKGLSRIFSSTTVQKHCQRYFAISSLSINFCMKNKLFLGIHPTQKYNDVSQRHMCKDIHIVINRIMDTV